MRKIFSFLVMFIILGASHDGSIGKSSIEYQVPTEERSPHFDLFKQNESISELRGDHENNYLDFRNMPMQQDITCMAKNIFYEAATESTAGKLAVAQVTLNRVESPHFPNTVCDVIYQGPHWPSGHPKRDRCQFSWYCDGLSDDPREGRLWAEAQDLAKHILKHKDDYIDITDGATHYHANWMEKYPSWSYTKKKMASIDQHIFYRSQNLRL